MVSGAALPADGVQVPSDGTSTDGIKEQLLASLRQKGTSGPQIIEDLALLRQGGHLQHLRDYTIAIAACGRQRSWGEAVNLFQELLSRGIDADVISWTAVLSACVSGRQWQRALAMFQEMRQRSFKFTAITYCRVIEACKSGGQWKYALHLLTEMLERGLAPNEVCHSACIIACMQAGRWQWAMEILVRAKHAGLVPRNIRACSFALNACAKSGHWRMALTLLAGMQQTKANPDIAHFCSAMNACVRGSHWEKALQLMAGMEQNLLEADTIAMGVSIKACEKGEKWEHAVQHLAEMRLRQLESHIVAHNHAACAFRRPEFWRLALGMLSEPEGRGVRVNAVTYGTVMGTFVSDGQWEFPLGLLHEMQRARVSPNANSRNQAIGACANGARWELVLALLAEWESLGFSPDAVTYGTLLGAYTRAGQWQRVLRQLASMRSSGLETNLIDLCTGTTACGRSRMWNRALQLFAEAHLDGLDHDPKNYNSAIAACGFSGRWQLSLLALADMLRARLEVDIASFGQVVSACENCQAWAEGDEVHEAQWPMATELLWCMQQRALEPMGSDFGTAISTAQKAGCWQHTSAVLEGFRAACAAGERPGTRAEALPKAISAGIDDQASWRHEEPIEVLGHGTGVIALSKPAGLTTRLILERLQALVGPVTTVSRLDGQTSGVLVAVLGAEGSPAAAVVQAQFAGRLVTKEYLCLCTGGHMGPPGTTGNVTAPLLVEYEKDGSALTSVSPEGVDARTQYEVLATYEAMQGNCTVDVLAFLLVKLFTGRTHQIRAHLASIGHPVVADPIYGAGRVGLDLCWCKRLFLHARRVSLRSLSGEPFVAETPMPADLERALACLKRVE